MKIEIELLDVPNEYKLQFSAVEKYIKENTLKIEEVDFLGIPVATKPTIRETAKNTGTKVQLEGHWFEYHVSCRRTKSGIYKFKVWRA